MLLVLNVGLIEEQSTRKEQVSGDRWLEEAHPNVHGRKLGRREKCYEIEKYLEYLTSSVSLSGRSEGYIEFEMN